LTTKRHLDSTDVTYSTLLMLVQMRATQAMAALLQPHLSQPVSLLLFCQFGLT
jgi:hypothetical protein